MNEWRFLFDENVDPKTVPYLRKEGVHAEHVRDALWLGADDREHVIPYAREHDLEPDAPGVVLLFDDTMPAYRVASALLRMIDTYPSRDEFTGREELDRWA